MHKCGLVNFHGFDDRQDGTHTLMPTYLADAPWNVFGRVRRQVSSASGAGTDNRQWSWGGVY